MDIISDIFYFALNIYQQVENEEKIYIIDFIIKTMKKNKDLSGEKKDPIKNGIKRVRKNSQDVTVTID